MPGSTVDFTPPFDPTSYIAITGAQLLQLLSGLAPYIDKGMTLVTTDIAGIPQVPDATVNTKWTNYLWIRQQAGTVGIYAWAVGGANTLDPTSGANMLLWKPVNVQGIANGSITGQMIADNTIPDSKIAGLNYSKLVGEPLSLPPSGPAGGALGGTYPNPTLGALSITGSEIQIATVTGGDGATVGNLGLKTVNVANMAGDNVAYDMMRTNHVDPTKMEWFTPTRLVDATAGVVTTNNLGKIPQVAVAGAGDTGTWQMSTPAQIGARVLQTVQTDSSAIVTCTTLNIATNASPLYNVLTAIPALNIAFVPVNAGNTCFVEAVVDVYVNGGNLTFVGIFNNNGATAPLAGVGIRPSGAGLQQVVVRYQGNIAAAETLYVAFGCNGNPANAFINSIDGANNPFLISKSSLKITEYL